MTPWVRRLLIVNVVVFFVQFMSQTSAPGLFDPFVFVPADYPDVPTFRPADDPFVFAVAPFRFHGERMGFLIAAAPAPGAQFDELTLRLLAGLADQAKLAL